MREAKYEITMTGFILGLIFVAMFGSLFAVLMSQLSNEYSVTNPETFDKYSAYTSNLTITTEDILNKSNIEPKEGLDIIGGYFSSGYAALKTAADSFKLFSVMLDDTTNEVPFLSVINFRAYLGFIILILIFIGVVIAVLTKMRI